MPRSTGGGGSSSSGSNRSDHGGTRKASSSSSSTNEYIHRLHETIGHERVLSATDHLKAAKLLCKVRNQISQGRMPSHEACVQLLCTGIALYRRHSVGTCVAAVQVGKADEGGEVAAEEAKQLVRRSSVLVFGVLCMIEQEKTMRSMEASMFDLDISTTSRDVVSLFGGSSLWDAISESKSKDDSETGAEDTGTVQNTSKRTRPTQSPPKSSWDDALRTSASEIAKHSLKVGTTCLDDESWIAFDKIAPFFFRNSASSMAEAMLMPDGDKDFVSLTTSDLLTEMTPELREKKLLAVVGAGESEAGQQVVRDLVLSFLLPSSHVGIRRTLLLTRESSTRAGVDYPEFVSKAHDIAMAGTEWIWTHGEDPLERMCCLLAGLAVLTTKADHDPIRKADAFCGMLQLPFFETKAPSRQTRRIALVPRSRRWILFHLDERGLPKVLSSQCGFEGLCNAVLVLVASLRS